MSVKHPIIAITGSSGAGTTSVTRTFESIFRREGVQAAIVEGDSFHRYDRKAMKIAMAQAEAAGNHHFSHFGDEANLFGTVGYNRPADAVWVDGKLTVKDGELVHIDEDKTAAQGRAEIDRLLKSAAVS